MPQFQNMHNMDGFVNPAELYTTLPTGYDRAMAVQHQYTTTYDSMPSNLLDQFASMDENSDQYTNEDAPEFSMKAPLSPVLPDDCSASSESNSPDPDNALTSQAQSYKRRAQNRAAQRAYRDRKTRYLVDLQSGIQDIEQNIRRLQTENTDLIRRLCEMRAANNDLRDSTRGKRRKDSVQDNSREGTYDPEEAWSRANISSATTGELDALYEPFAAMWNLIHLDPSVVRGTVSAHTVLERLRAMVELTGSRDGVRSSRAGSWPTSAPNENAQWR